MTIVPTVDALHVGDVISVAEIPVDRARLVRYAGASGDFNPIHWSDKFADEVGLPGVIAHGMLTMGLAISVLGNVLDDPTRIIDYGVRFTKPIAVPDVGQAVVTITATVGAVDLEANTVRIDLQAVCAETRVLGKAQATIRLG